MLGQSILELVILNTGIDVGQANTGARAGHGAHTVSGVMAMVLPGYATPGTPCPSGQAGPCVYVCPGSESKGAMGSKRVVRNSQNQSQVNPGLTI